MIHRIPLNEDEDVNFIELVDIVIASGKTEAIDDFAKLLENNLEQCEQEGDNWHIIHEILKYIITTVAENIMSKRFPFITEKVKASVNNYVM